MVNTKGWALNIIYGNCFFESEKNDVEGKDDVSADQHAMDTSQNGHSEEANGLIPGESNSQQMIESTQGAGDTGADN